MILQQCRRKVVLGCFGGEFDFVSPLDSMQAAFFGRGQALVWRAETDPKGPETTRRAAGSSYCHVACPFMWPPWSCEKHHTPTHGSLGHTHRTKKNVPIILGLWLLYPNPLVQVKGIYCTRVSQLRVSILLQLLLVGGFKRKLCSSLGVIIRYLWLNRQKCETTKQIIIGSTF